MLLRVGFMDLGVPLRLSFWQYRTCAGRRILLA
jgi:hypothetical protein